MPASSTETLFSSANALPPEERPAFLLKACANDGERARVEELLRAETHARSFVKETSKPDPAGEVIGREYRLLHELGEGGCGTVYLAEQLAPVRREVALKVIKLGMDTRAVINRFEAERQALAMMDHPHIAKVFDAGTTPAGRPYFVMELVRGIKITEYCEQCRLTLDERLELFIQVCQAIQHAHLKGVIHRDVKPSNVLVTLHDGKPVVKVIDFGVAKAMQGRLTDETVYTLFDQFIGTPAYVSPEQTHPGALGVDTRSDVYSLGALLYELITGGTPFDNEDLLQAGLETMRRRLLAEAPPRPSKRIDTLSLRLQRQPQDARTPPHFQRVERVRGDLDWIVMCCLEKDKERRYQSVGELAADLQRFLNREPISARAPSAWYVLRKFTERHRAAVTAASLTVCALLVATAVSTWLAVRATHAEGLAQETIDALVSVFDVADPFASHGAPFSADELLKGAQRTAYADLSAYPGAQARLLESLGRVLRRRGNHKESVEVLRDAVRLRRAHAKFGGSALIPTILELSAAEAESGNSATADRLLTEAEALIQQFGLEHSRFYVRLLLRRAIRQNGLGNIAKAQEHVTAALAVAREIEGPGRLLEAELLATLSLIHQWNDEFEEAERLGRESLSIYQRLTPATHPDRVFAEVKVAEAVQHQGRLPEAAQLFEAALAKTLAVYGRDSGRTADILDSLAHVKLELGLAVEAEQHAREGLRIAQAARGPDHFFTAYFHTSLANALLVVDRYREAQDEASRALEILGATQPADHPYVSSAEYALAEAELGLGDLEGADRTLRAAIDRSVRVDAVAWRVARLRSAQGDLLQRRGRAREAETLLVASYRTLATAVGAPRDAVIRARERVIEVYRSLRKDAELELVLASVPDRRAIALAPDESLVEGSASSSVTVLSEPGSPVAH